MSKPTDDGYHLRGQRGQLKVEYKESSVTCFLCLKLVRSPLPSPRGCDGDGGTSPKKEVIDKTTVQALFRYLNVDAKDDLQKKVSSSEGKNGGEKEETVEIKTDTSLLLCKGCSLVTGELIKLVEKLELTKIWINQWMRQLVDILSRSTIGPKSRKKRRGWSDDSLASLLRGQVKKNCISKLRKTDFPKVSLERHDNDSSGRMEIENDKKSNLLIPTVIIKEENEEEQNHRGGGEDVKQPQGNKERNDHMHVEVGPVVHVKEEKALNPTPTSKIPIVIMLCPFCDETVSSNSGLNRHTAAVHPEQFLSSAKSTDLSDQQFKSICQNFLSKLCQVKIIDKKRGCHFCPVTSGNKIYLKAHLIHGHHPILLRKLELLQNGIEEIDNTEDFVTADSSPKLKSLVNLVPQRHKNFYCRYCSKICITQWSLKRHVLLTHRFSTTMPAIAKKIPKPKPLKHTCEHCGEKVSVGYLKTHQQQCLASLKELESPPVPSVHHLQLPVQPPWPEREVKGPKDEALPLDVVSWECMECEQSFATLDQLDSHRNLPICSKKVEGPITSLKCSECEAYFWHLASLCKHRKKCHPDPSSRGNRPAYYKELKLKPEIFPCRFCGRSFSREDSLRRHLSTACKSVSECQKKQYPPATLIRSKTSSPSQSDSGFINTEPIVVLGNDSAAGYYNEDNDYDGDSSNMVPEYDPLM